MYLLTKFLLTLRSELAAGGIVSSLVAMLQKDEVQGQVYAAGALTRMAADPNVQEQIVAAGAIPPLISIMKDNVGAAPTAAGACFLIKWHHLHSLVKAISVKTEAFQRIAVIYD